MAQKWRQTANLIDDAETPWGSIQGLSDQTWRLGTELLETPSTSLTDKILIARQKFLIHRSCGVGENASPVHLLLRAGSRYKNGIVGVVRRSEQPVDRPTSRGARRPWLSSRLSAKRSLVLECSR
jgi:hypothetical protein